MNDDIYLLENIRMVLKPEEYQLIKMTYIEGYSLKEAAAKLNIEYGTCKMRMCRSLKKIRLKKKQVID